MLFSRFNKSFPQLNKLFPQDIMSFPRLNKSFLRDNYVEGGDIKLRERLKIEIYMSLSGSFTFYITRLCFKILNSHKISISVYGIHCSEMY